MAGEMSDLGYTLEQPAMIPWIAQPVSVEVYKLLRYDSAEITPRRRAHEPGVARI